MKRFSFFLMLFINLIFNAQKSCSLVYGDLCGLIGRVTISVTVEFDSLKVDGYGTEKEFVEKMKQKTRNFYSGIS